MSRNNPAWVLPAALIVSLSLGGCASSVYLTEAGKLGDAADAVAKAMPTDAVIKSAADPNAEITRNGFILNNAPLAYGLKCMSQAHAFRVGVILSAGQPEKAQDDTYQAGLKTVDACKLDDTAFAMELQKPASAAENACVAEAAPPPPAVAPVTEPPRSRRGRHAPRPAAAPPAVTVAAAQGWSAVMLPERCAVRQQAVQAALAPQDVQGANPAAKPDPKYALDAYVAALSEYAKNLKAITAANSLDDVNKALDGAGASLTSLVKAAKGPDVAAGVSLETKLVGLALEQAQYEALRRSAREFDKAWDQVAPSVKTALRLREAQLIEDRATINFGYAASASAFLNSPRAYASPAERLQLFTTMNGKVDEAAARLEASKVDPAGAIDAFTNASGELTKALDDPKRQVGALQKEVQELQKLAEGLKAKPAAK